MGSRVVTNLLILETAGFLVVASFAFGPHVVDWIGLGVGCTATVAALAGFAVRGRGADQRWLDVATAVIGGWLIVAARVFGADTSRWLCFSAADGLIVLATLGLVRADLARARLVRELAETAAHDHGNGRAGAGFAPHAPQRVRMS